MSTLGWLAVGVLAGALAATAVLEVRRYRARLRQYRRGAWN